MQKNPPDKVAFLKYFTNFVNIKYITIQKLSITEFRIQLPYQNYESKGDILFININTLNPMKKLSTYFLSGLFLLTGILLSSVSTQAEELVTVKFITPTEGISAPARVSVEATGDEPERVFEADADGITYHLPAGREVWFEVFPDEEAGFFVSQWIMDGSPIAYSSYLTSYASEAYEGMTLEVEFEREDVFYTVEFEAPYGTMIRCVNRSADGGDTPVESGEKIAAASNLLFMISPETNPDGEVALKHWLINGRVCVDGSDEPITNNSIEFKLLEDVKVTAVLDDLSGVEAISNEGLYCLVSEAMLKVCNADGTVAVYDLLGKQLAARIAENGEAIFTTSDFMPGIYIVRNNNISTKVIIR